MKKNGRLQEGINADIVVFYPKTISAVGTYEAPDQPAVGVQSSLVNFSLVAADGKLVLDTAPEREPIVGVSQREELYGSFSDVGLLNLYHCLVRTGASRLAGT